MDTAKLERYKTQLAEMRRRLTTVVGRMEENILDAAHPPGEISHAPTHQANVDSEGVDTEITLAQNEEGILQQVDSALQRIAEGTYGRCQACGRPIGEERLKALPYTPYCVDDARKHTSGGRP